MAKTRDTHLPDDPLGPTRIAPIGRPISPLKRHWMAHGTQWLIGLGCLAVVPVVGLIFWAVKASTEFYSTSSNAPPLAPAPVAPTPLPSVVRTVKGSVRLDLEIGDLEEAERVIVMRDVVEILKTRLQQNGIEISANAPDRLTLSYSERKAEAIDVRQAKADGSIESVNSMRPIRINVKLTLSQPQQPLWLLGEASRTYNGSAIELDPTDSTTRLGIQRRKLYHQSYQAVLNYLRTVELPEGEA